MTNSRAGGGARQWRIDEAGNEASLRTLADVHDKSSGDGRRGDPFTGEVLDLETGMRRSLEELRRRSAVAII